VNRALAVLFALLIGLVAVATVLARVGALPPPWR
jgi:hypothetical protein